MTTDNATSLALEAWELSRSTLLAHLRFMGAAFAKLRLLPIPGATLATDGSHIRFDPAWVLKQYRNDQAFLTRAYLHAVLHNVFLHPFCDPSTDPALWGAACDVAVEAAIDDLALPFAAPANRAARDAALAPVKAALPLVSAETVYRYLREAREEGRLSADDVAQLRELFYVDDHAVWHAVSVAESAATGKQGDASEDPSAVERDAAGGPAPTAPSDDGIDMPFLEEARTAKRQRKSHQAMSSDDVFKKDAPEEAHGTNMGRFADSVTLDRARDQWKNVAYEMGVQLDSYRKLWGAEGSSLSMSLREVTRKRQDYRDFLRKFAHQGETMRINDDEFDYVFYTFGLRKYGNLPLIEPLEFAEEKRIRDFVIAIDTSASTKDGLVRKFIERTYSILADETSFFADMNVLVVQCDAAVTDVATIKNARDLEDYLRDLTVEGLGGTDFRPVFALVNDLVECGELTNLGGLVYFTDGHGTFPSRKPAFETAFVFVDDYDDVQVPPWAMKVVLEETIVLQE